MVFSTTTAPFVFCETKFTAAKMFEQYWWRDASPVPVSHRTL
jgi:hypothetical protein